MPRKTIIRENAIMLALKENMIKVSAIKRYAGRNDENFSVYRGNYFLRENNGGAPPDRPASNISARRLRRRRGLRVVPFYGPFRREHANQRQQECFGVLGKRWKFELLFITSARRMLENVKYDQSCWRNCDPRFKSNRKFQKCWHVKNYEIFLAPFEMKLELSK